MDTQADDPRPAAVEPREGPDVDPVVLRRLALGVVMGCFAGPALPGWVARDLRDGLGALCLFGSNLSGDDEQAAALTAQVHDLAPTCLVALDEEGGDVTRLDQRRGSRTVGAAVLGAVDDVGLTRRLHADLGSRLAAVGVDLDLAPVLDVNSAADNPVIGSRSFGADAALVARHGVAAVQGLADAGVAACVKHFPGHGDTVHDSHVGAAVVTASARLLHERELVPFGAAVDAGAEAVMTAHVRARALDPDRPASTSPVLTALLREGLGFTGVVVTDALDMAGVSGPDAHGSVGRAAVASLAAGADLLCLGADWDRERVHGVVEAVVDAVRRGALARDRLEEAAARVRRLGVTARQRRRTANPSVPIGTSEGFARCGPSGPSLRSREQPEALAQAQARVERAAREGTHLTGRVPPPAATLVVRLLDDANAAVGEVPWGLLAHAGDLLPGPPAAVTGQDARPDDDPAPVLAAAAGRVLVVVCRDSHRSPTVRRWLALVVQQRPDLVLVDLGWPSPDTVVPASGALLRTHGASPASARAAAVLLTGTLSPLGSASGGGGAVAPLRRRPRAGRAA